MKRIFISSIFIIILSFSLTTLAQNDNSDRQKWFTEMRNYKHKFLTKELDLSKEQQTEFFKLYDSMEDETNKINHEIREQEHKIHENASSTTDKEYEAAAKKIFELKIKEGEIELRYFDKFKEVLTSKQLFLLKNAERKFTRRIMAEHNRRSQGKSAPEK